MDARERYDDLADFLAFRHDFVELSPDDGDAVREGAREDGRRLFGP